ncbi:hypothetical protein GPK34_00235 [Secundilactobacillus kimchicus]|uniref:hypothetical protein n=1 Tax=Secundilactobacillus kimchicus TaxID=528209 RepID=UPI001C01DE2D|nr:hypothetical protein [Secundilactobacillus kimchicus]MBT9670464.1 hypothetical protein [Secundilactobacillus kimchicus]
MFGTKKDHKEATVIKNIGAFDGYREDPKLSKEFNKLKGNGQLEIGYVIYEQNNDMLEDTLGGKSSRYINFSFDDVVACVPIENDFLSESSDETFQIIKDQDSALKQARLRFSYTDALLLTGRKTAVYKVYYQPLVGDENQTAKLWVSDRVEGLAYLNAGVPFTPDEAEQIFGFGSAEPKLLDLIMERAPLEVAQELLEKSKSKSKSLYKIYSAISSSPKLFEWCLKFGVYDLDVYTPKNAHERWQLHRSSVEVKRGNQAEAIEAIDQAYLQELANHKVLGEDVSKEVQELQQVFSTSEVYNIKEGVSNE